MEIRPWRAGDERLAALADLSARSLDQRFLAGTGGMLPLAYVRHITAGPRPEWDAHVAEHQGRLIGWAEYGRHPGILDTADLAVIVADAWHRRGIATTLIRALLPRAHTAGVRDLHADLLPGNTAAQGLLRSLFRDALHGRFEDGTLHFEVALTEAVVPAPALSSRA